MAVIYGTNGNDILQGTSADDVINGGAGHDRLIGAGGADRFDGGDGFDNVDYTTSASGVTVNLIPDKNGVTRSGIGGDAQGDTYTSIESIVGSAFNDVLSSSIKHGTLAGGKGNDVYFVTDNDVLIDELSGEGVDELIVSLSASIARIPYLENLTANSDSGLLLIGNNWHNIITGGAGDDAIHGGAGNDRLIGAEGADRFNGGDGFDNVDYTTSVSGVTVNLIPDKNGVTRSGIGGDAQGDTYTSIESIVGSAFNDVLSSSIKHGTLAGGKGNDVYFVTDNDVLIDELSGEGVDELIVSLSASIARIPYLENLTANSDSGLLLIGNNGDNIITGGAGDDTMRGEGGKDTIVGNAGNDLITIGEGGTAFGGEGNDTIRATGFVYELHGNEGSDTITFEGGNAFGSSGNDTINVNGTGFAFGGEGDDTLTGTGFFYELYGEDGDDTLVLQTSGSADGGDGGDAYYVRSNSIAYIKDSGISGVDTLRLDSIGNYQDLSLIRQGDDLFLSSYSSNHSKGVVLEDWYAGFASIENLFLADGSRLPLYDFA